MHIVKELLELHIKSACREQLTKAEDTESGVNLSGTDSQK